MLCCANIQIDMHLNIFFIVRFQQICLIEMFRTFGIVGLLFVLSLTFCDGLREGDACQVLRSGAAGTCKLLRNCQEALDTILQTGQFPAHCDWNMNREEVICCQNPVTKKPKPTQSNRLSARSKN